MSKNANQIVVTSKKKDQKPRTPRKYNYRIQLPVMSAFSILPE